MNLFYVSLHGLPSCKVLHILYTSTYKHTHTHTHSGTHKPVHLRLLELKLVVQREKERDREEWIWNKKGHVEHRLCRVYSEACSLGTGETRTKA